MKLLKQFLIILFVSFLGEILNYLIPLPIPASIYGILIMFLALELHIIPLSCMEHPEAQLDHLYGHHVCYHIYRNDPVRKGHPGGDP